MSDDNRDVLRTAITEAISKDSVTTDELMRALSILLQPDQAPVAGVTKKQPKQETAERKKQVMSEAQRMAKAAALR